MNDKIINTILDKYSFTSNERIEFKKMIYPIFISPNFQQRLKKNFPHHGKIPLGEHILCDAAVTYKLCQKNSYKKTNRKLAVIIAMMHDLYTSPWKTKNNKKRKFYNYHAFRHPLEAVINSISWYPEYFKNLDDAKIIIDGIIHHMFPLPVRRIDDCNLQLEDKKLYEIIPNSLKNIIYKSSNNGICIWHFSLSKPEYREGKLVSKADKRVSILNDTLLSIKLKIYKIFKY